jgi:hypothetical protein
MLCTGRLSYFYVLLYVVSDFEGVAFLEEVLIWSRPQGLAKMNEITQLQKDLLIARPTVA